MLTLVAAVLAYDCPLETCERRSERSLSLKVRSDTRDEKDMVGGKDDSGRVFRKERRRFWRSRCEVSCIAVHFSTGAHEAGGSTSTKKERGVYWWRIPQLLFHEELVFRKGQGGKRFQLCRIGDYKELPGSVV